MKYLPTIKEPTIRRDWSTTVNWRNEVRRQLAIAQKHNKLEDVLNYEINIAATSYQCIHSLLGLTLLPSSNPMAERSDTINIHFESGKTDKKLVSMYKIEYEEDDTTPTSSFTIQREAGKTISSRISPREFGELSLKFQFGKSIDEERQLPATLISVSSPIFGKYSSNRYSYGYLISQFIDSGKPYYLYTRVAQLSGGNVDNTDVELPETSKYFSKKEKKFYDQHLYKGSTFEKTHVLSRLVILKEILTGERTNIVTMDQLKEKSFSIFGIEPYYK